LRDLGQVRLLNRAVGPGFFPRINNYVVFLAGIDQQDINGVAIASERTSVF
jgi:hypothetical protein